ncbi:MAG: sigma 54-interacting transcriptional regulator [Acidobacteria bacterium]|nr:sigma 54-interacting transcriptional regulator [Acidobacteriota bacterium]
MLPVPRQHQRHHSAGAPIELVTDQQNRSTAYERALIDAAQALTSRLDVRDTCGAMLDVVERIFAAEASWILLHDRRSDMLVAAEYRGRGGDLYADLEVPPGRGIIGQAFSSGEPVFVPDVSQEDRWFDPERVHRSGLASVFTVPLIYNDERIGAMGFYSPRFGPEALPSEADRCLLQGLGALASIGIRNARLFDEVASEKTRRARASEQQRRLRTEVGHLRSEIRTVLAHGTIIGRSHGIAHVLQQLQVVAPADTTVLLLGETGTGKELFARAIHDGSRRARSVFLPVNCAAIPATLLESELFGYEKGAFTGAVERRAGKFELAHGGTLFLDEIGELPPEAQAQLLRVLQDGEVTRLGAMKPVTVNVRVIAATNQDLAARMETGAFRPDLYYRLSVFPVFLPPLRERPEDIPLLAAHFVDHFAARQHTSVPRLSDDPLAKLQAYDWPGNVRELQNVIERAVLLAGGGEITAAMIPNAARPSRAGAASTATPAPDTGPATPQSFEEAESNAILLAVEASGWRISGEGGAARLLGLKPTTLHAKMKKLGIRRPGRHLSD